MIFKINGKQFAKNVADTLRRKVLTLVSNDFREESTDLYAQMIEPYVPKDTGKLRNSYTIENGGKMIVYNTDYAEKVYTVPAKHYTTPGTTHHWDIDAKPLIWDDYMEAVNQLAKEYMSRVK